MESKAHLTEISIPKWLSWYSLTTEQSRLSCPSGFGYSTTTGAVSAAAGGLWRARPPRAGAGSGGGHVLV